jgi:hypothetical protein
VIGFYVRSNGMKRTSAICLIAALILALFVIPASGAFDDYSALMKLIADNEDVRMNAMDLAFLLATHNFDATPENGYVIVKLESMIYSLTPNGEKPGLAEVTIINDTNSSPE